jgi:hypothetical protein
VKAVGSADSIVRTASRTATAKFFSGNAFAQFNAALRNQAAKRGLDIVRAAWMFAAVDTTVADAFITTWRAKLFYGFWRPSSLSRRRAGRRRIQRQGDSRCGHGRAGLRPAPLQRRRVRPAVRRVTARPRSGA